MTSIQLTANSLSWAIIVTIVGCSSSSPSPGLLDSGSTFDSSPPLDAALADGEAPEAGIARANDAGNTANLQWYFTCGDPVCETPDASATLTDVDGGPCPTVGQSCSTLGDTCGTRNPALDCGATEVCENHDPTASPNGCPMSSRQFKNDIQYVDGAELERLHDETLGIRLATYHYKGQYADPNPRHLGFIIEDDPSSPSVDPSHDRVDLYGYLSMVVATMKVQEKEIAELRRELAETSFRSTPRAESECGSPARASRQRRAAMSGP